jgi:hypothetical protein
LQPGLSNRLDGGLNAHGTDPGTTRLIHRKNAMLQAPG